MVSKAEKIAKINTIIEWGINLSKNPNSNAIHKNIDTFDELILFLSNSAKFWKKYESNTTTEVALFSAQFENATKIVSEFLKKYDGAMVNLQTLPQTFNQITATFEITGISFNVMSQRIVISIPVCDYEKHSSVVTNAYINYYLKNDDQAFAIILTLVAAPQNFASYISNARYCKGAIAYLAFISSELQILDKNRQNSNRLTDISDQANELETQLVERRSEISELVADFNKELTEQKRVYEEQLKSQKELSDQQISAFEEECKAAQRKIKDLEDAYSEKLMLTEPVEHWKSEAKSRGRSAIKWTCASVLSAIILLVLCAIIFIQLTSINDQDDIIHFVPWGFVLTGTISFIVYIIRTFVKIAMSEKHLESKYKEKAALTYFYLSLTKNGDAPDEKQKAIIYSTLFSQFDTGLVKHGDSNIDLSGIIGMVGK